MKKYFAIFKFFVVFFIIQLCPIESYNQAKYFYNALPDSLKPNSPNKLLFNDLTKIFLFVLNAPNLEDRFHKETKDLFLKHGDEFDKIKNKKNRLDFIIAAHRYARIAIEDKKVAAEYIFALKKELDDNSKGYENYLGQYYLLNNWYFKYFKANKIEAYENLVKGLNLAKQIKDSTLMRNSYYSLSHLYASLRLLPQSIAYTDSTFSIQKRIKTNNIKLAAMQYHAFKADVYHDFYIDTYDKAYIDSSRKYIDLVPYENNDNIYKYLETASLLLKTWIFYHENNVAKTSQLIDSLVIYGSADFVNDPSFLALKALNNLKTGKSKSEIENLKRIDENYDVSIMNIVYPEAIKFAKKYGNYNEALYYQERQLKFISSQNNIKSEAVIFERELNNKLTAKDLAISKLNDEKNMTYFWGILLAFGLLMFILLFYVRARRTNRRRNQLLQQIDTITETQISHLQLAENQAKANERKIMGQELHDDLAGTLATLKLNLEIEAEKTQDKNQQNRLNELSKSANEAYQLARGKSHEWFDIDSLNKNRSFFNIINELLEKGLPHEFFQKEISIEENAIQNFSTETMVEFIYITKEAITNIVKYADADKISLLIYEEMDEIIYEISDNGKGFDLSNNHKGMGIKSIKNRVNKLKGDFNINSNETGTELQIVLPKSRMY